MGYVASVCELLIASDRLSRLLYVGRPLASWCTCRRRLQFTFRKQHLSCNTNVKRLGAPSVSLNLTSRHFTRPSAVNSANMSRKQKHSPSSNPSQNASSQPVSKLFKLPAEIRNCIYEMVFEGAKVTIPIRHTSANPHLLMSCKTIYGEARQLYYNKCHFRLCNTSDLRRWLEIIGLASRKSLMSLEIAPPNLGRSSFTLALRTRRVLAGDMLCHLDHILQARDTDIKIGGLKVLGYREWWCWNLDADGNKVAVQCWIEN